MTHVAPEALEAMAEMERNTPQQIKQMRSHARISVRAKVIIQPGNSSQRNDSTLQAILGDISRGGCLVLASAPLGVGDIYRLSFDRAAVDLEPVFGRCVRCRLIREDAYETGFSFFHQLDLSRLEQQARTSDLLD